MSFRLSSDPLIMSDPRTIPICFSPAQINPDPALYAELAENVLLASAGAIRVDLSDLAYGFIKLVQNPAYGQTDLTPEAAEKMVIACLRQNSIVTTPPTPPSDD